MNDQSKITANSNPVRHITTKSALIRFLYHVLDRSEPQIPVKDIVMEAKHLYLDMLVKKEYIQFPLFYSGELLVSICWDKITDPSADRIGINLLEFLVKLGDGISNATFPNPIPKAVVIATLYGCDAKTNSGLYVDKVKGKIVMKISEEKAKKWNVTVNVRMPDMVIE